MIGKRQGKTKISAADPRLLTAQEIAAIELRADVDYLSRHDIGIGQMRRALTDRDLLLRHIYALRAASHVEGGRHE